MSGDAGGVDLHAGQHQGQHDRQVDDRHHDQQRHQADRKRDVRLGDLRQLGQKRGAGGRAEQQQPDLHVLASGMTRVTQTAVSGTRTKLATSAMITRRTLRSGSSDLRHGQPEAHAEHAGDDEGQREHVGQCIQNIGHHGSPSGS